MTDIELVKKAEEAYKNAYAPYSKTPVGAALLCRGGRVVTGCNVENASYGLTVCAERAAVCRAVGAGLRDFVKIAIASPQKKEFSPCGACRQVIAEFGPDIKVVWKNAEGRIRSMSIRRLLPVPFKNNSKGKHKGNP